MFTSVSLFLLPPPVIVGRERVYVRGPFLFLPKDDCWALGVRLLSVGGGGRRIILPITPNPRSAKKSFSLSLVSNLMRSYRYCRAGAEYTEKLASGNAMVFSIVCFRHAHIRAFFLSL